jgi:hypothetical protein
LNEIAGSYNKILNINFHSIFVFDYEKNKIQTEIKNEYSRLSKISLDLKKKFALTPLISNA